MKSSAWLVLPFLLFACTKPSMAAGLEAPEPVRDIKGDILRAGTEYYIVSAIWGAGGGGLTMGSIGEQICPLAVVQEPFDLLRGLPLTFTPVDPKKGVIRTSTDLNIKFSCDLLPPICPGQSTVWKVTKSDDPNIQWFVATGGVEGNPGCDTVTNWFKIEKSGWLKAYKLVFCPSVCGSRDLCRDIGLYFYGGSRILSLSDAIEAPFPVLFLKASTTSKLYMSAEN